MNEKNGVERIVKLRDEFLEKFPEQITLEYRCYVETVEGQEDCVWDEDKPNDCCIATKGIKKEDCKHWRQETIPAVYSADELREWIDKNLAI